MVASAPRGGLKPPDPLGRRRMRRTPWKLVAGGLVLSVGGLAGVGGVPLRAGQVACVQQPEPAVPVIPPLPQAPAAQEPTTAPPTIVLTPADLPGVPAAP